MSRGDILIVDDHPNNLTLLAGMLREAGFEVRAANSVARSIPIATARPPDLVLRDIQMPEMNGYIRRHDREATRKAPLAVTEFSASAGTRSSNGTLPVMPVPEM